MKQVVVYHQPDCAACRQAMEFLTGRGVTFTQKNVQEDASAMRELIQMRVSTTPILVIDGEVIEGFDADRIDAALAG